MDKLLISGGIPLKGNIRISGAKNAVLPILAATLLVQEPVVISNIPHLNDVTTTMELLGRMNVQLMMNEKMNINKSFSNLVLFFLNVPRIKKNRENIPK